VDDSEVFKEDSPLFLSVFVFVPVPVWESVGFAVLIVVKPKDRDQLQGRDDSHTQGFHR
jgi:hypothetical protein